MSVILDVATVIIFVFVVFTSYRKGFIKSVFELAGYFVSVGVSYILSAPLGDWIYNTFVKDIVNTQVHNYIFSSINNSAAAQANNALSRSDITNFANNIPDQFKSMLNNYHVSVGAINNIAGSTIQSGSDAIANNIISTIVMPIASIISRGIAFAVIFILCMVAVRFLAGLTDVIFKLPGIGSVNRVAGGAIGIAKAFFVMFLLCTVLAVIVPVISLQNNPPISNEVINNTAVFKTIYYNNPLDRILFKQQ